jgi:hypothetical protein
MQKLKYTWRLIARNNRGTVLVGAVALAVLIAIGSIGFIQVTTSCFNSGIAALGNEQAFRAAESGVWVGARWLRDPANGFAAINAPVTLNPFGSNPVDIDNQDVYISIPVRIETINGVYVPVATIIADVFKDPSGSHRKNKDTFKKRITVSEVRVQNFGAYCTFYDGYQSPAPENQTITRWHGWFGRVFNGRFHMNNMYNEIAGAGAPGNGVNSVIFNGLVTIARTNDAVVMSHYTNNYSALYGGTGHYDNNYDNGIWVEDAASSGGVWTNLTPTEFDRAFLNRYLANVDPIDLNVGRTDATLIFNDVSLAGPIINLPHSFRDDGYGPNQYRPTLYFDGQKAVYKYKSDVSATSYDSVTWGSVDGSAGSIDGLTFVSKDVVGGIAGNHLNVYTTNNGATGRVTVATAIGKSIVPVGNIVTSDYNPALGENAIHITSNNMIGLISGQYIAFNKTWIKRFEGADADVMKYVSEQVTGGGAPGPDGGNGTLHISASIIAVNTFNDVFDGNTYAMKGCEFWDGWWDITSKHAGYSDIFTDDNCHLQDYSFQLFGNHVLRGYINTIGDHSRYGCNGTLEFTPDSRMVKKFIQPPSFPLQVKTTTGQWVLELAGWSEGNVYVPAP